MFRASLPRNREYMIQFGENFDPFQIKSRYAKCLD